jgi:hypothetical protein
MLKRTTLQVKNIDPLTTKEESPEAICKELQIRDLEQVDVKTLRRAAPWKTRCAIVVVPTNCVPEDGTIKFKIGWAIATGRMLRNLVRCFKCHDFGHVAARCTSIDAGNEICRRCGLKEQIMKECSNEPRCTLCVNENKDEVKHVTGSLACSVTREIRKEHIYGRRAVN